MNKPVVVPEQAAAIIMRLIAERDLAERRLQDAVAVVLAALNAKDDDELRLVNGRLVIVSPDE
jgi:hypothetical protein